MAPISSGIDKVRVFELPGGIRADGRSVGSPRTALVRWHSSLPDKFYQVYVNGQYGGATIDRQQRQMTVQLPDSLEMPVRIEVFAVEPALADIDFSEETALPDGQMGRVRITLLRSQNLPIDSVAQIYFDNGTGQIDYDSPLDDLPIRIWPSWQDKAGFGLSRFGAGDFGYDSAAAVGCGVGCFGRGQFGLGADTIEWVSRLLEAGVYKFAVGIIDKAGNKKTSEAGQVTVIPPAKAAEGLGISSFNRQTNQLVLTVS